MRTVAVLTAFTLGVSALAVSSTAEARWRGGGVAAGVIGGVAAGALIAGASRGYSSDYYAPSYYGGPAYAYGPSCHMERERVWDGYGYRIRRVRVCN